jgi:hypothetical protein
LIFVETTRFTRQICELVTDASYAKLQTWVASNPRVGDLMLLAFAKSEQEDLTREQLKLLKKVVEQELRNG